MTKSQLTEAKRLAGEYISNCGFKELSATAIVTVCKSFIHQSQELERLKNYINEVYAQLVRVGYEHPAGDEIMKLRQKYHNITEALDG